MNEPDQKTNAPWCRFEQLANGESSVIGCFYPDDIDVDKSLYPYHVFIGYGYDKEGSARLPNAEEWSKIDSIEKTIADVLKENDFGFLLFTIASDGYYQWNIYSKTGDETALAILGSLKKFGSSPKIDLFEYESSRDAGWATYKPIRESIIRALNKAMP